MYANLSITYYAFLSKGLLVLAPIIAPIMDSSKQALNIIQNDENVVLKSGSSRVPIIPTIAPNALQMNGVYQTLLGCVLQIKKLAPAITMA